ncbi:MAG: hypothetical protein APF81_15150 [Desulfosporosinus sp. BRH_c37]|nr:MAG: hypothetical protein APF81_15150 [Desulfosporosinus sp. BRH_c37]
MELEKNIHVNEWVDNLKFNRFHAILMILTGLSLFFDGFDSQIIAYIMPQLIKEWHLTPVVAGSIVSYGFVGLMIGAVGFGMLSDFIGRKKSLMIALSVFTLFSGAAYLAPNFNVFVTLRFFAGLGMGGTLPIAITLVSEFAPAKIRAKVVTGMFAGFNLGWAGAGLAAMSIIPKFGWRPVLLVGMIPLLFIPFLGLYLPESLRYLGSKKRFGKAIKEINRLERVAGLNPRNWVNENVVQPEPEKKVGISILFSRKLILMTILIGLTYFFAFLCNYGLSSWLPTLLVQKGFTLTKSYSYGIVQAVGASAGGFLLGYLMDKFGRKKGLIFSFLVGGISVWMFGFVSSNAFLLFLGVLTGAFIMGAPIAMHVICGEIYPTHARATGVGFALTVGRLGSILGPILGGVLLTMGFSFSQYFLIFAIPAFVAAVLVMLYRTDAKGESLENINTQTISH